METAAIPIEYILASRRINYLHNILTKEDSELVKRVYSAQIENPSKGDWCHNVKMDMELISLNMNNCEIISMSKNKFKMHVKKCMTSATFKSLKALQSEHSKIRDISYTEYRLQSYLKCDKLNKEESSTIFNMRANTVNSFKICFPTLYTNDTLCKLGCQGEDSIRHVFQCEELGPQSNINYNDIFSNESMKKEVVVEFLRRCQLRSAVLAARASQGQQLLDTSTQAAAGGAGGRAREMSLPVSVSCE